MNLESIGAGARVRGAFVLFLQRGFALARNMLAWARTARDRGIAGAYLIPPFKRYEEILELFG